jgi:hypothetical protein
MTTRDRRPSMAQDVSEGNGLAFVGSVSGIMSFLEGRELEQAWS